MTALTTLPAAASTEQILEVIRADGAVILADVLAPAEINQFRTELDPYMDATAAGQDDFTGRSTTRTGALVARSAKARDMIMNETVVKAANEFLAPFCQRIQLHLTQIIRLRPGQGKQMIHRDRWAWGRYMQNMEPQFNTIWAMTDFTKENGATQIIPGSANLRRHPNAEKVTAMSGVIPIECAPGSVAIWDGNIWHASGERTNPGERVVCHITYTRLMMRPVEDYRNHEERLVQEHGPAMAGLFGQNDGLFSANGFDYSKIVQTFNNAKR